MAAKAYVVGGAFLGLELKCARCHDAPYHDYLQKDLFEMAAMLARKPVKVPASSSVPKAFFERQTQEGGRESLIKVSIAAGSTVAPAWPFEDLNDALPEELLRDPADTRERFAALVTLPGNQRFAEVMVNRVWKRFMGLGFVEPANDWQDAVPSHPALLRWLAAELQASGYDTKHIARLILNSETYQRRAVPAPASSDAALRHFVAPLQRRMSAEQVVDSLHAVTGRRLESEELNFNLTGRQKNELITLGFPRRAWQFGSISTNRDRPSLALAKAQAVIDVLEAFGWRSDRADPLTDRPNHETNLRQPAALANSVLTTWVTRLSDDAEITQAAVAARELDALVTDTYQRLLTRDPTEAERAAARDLLGPGFAERVIDGAEPLPPPTNLRYTTWYNHLHPSATPVALEDQARALQGPPPTPRLQADWRERMEDLVWTLINAPEFIYVD